VHVLEGDVQLLMDHLEKAKSKPPFSLFLDTAACRTVVLVDLEELVE